MLVTSLMGEISYIKANILNCCFYIFSQRGVLESSIESKIAVLFPENLCFGVLQVSISRCKLPTKHGTVCSKTFQLLQIISDSNVFFYWSIRVKKKSLNLVSHAAILCIQGKLTTAVKSTGLSSI